jgi:uncharacterized membrane protein
MPRADRHSGFSWWGMALFLAALVAGTWLRFKGLTFQSLWIDELTSISKSRPDLSLAEVIGQFTSSEDPHPPLYFALLHIWLWISNYSEYAARFFSALIGSFGLLAIYFLGRELGGRRCGLVATGLLVANHFHMVFSQEVRSYGLLFLLAALSYLYFIRGLRRQGFLDLIGYCLLTTLMIYTHYFGLMVIVSQVLFSASYLALQPRIDRKKPALRYGLACIGIVVLYSPWIPVVIETLNRGSFWTSEPEGAFFVHLFHRFLGDEPFLIVLAAAFSLCVLFLFILQRARKQELGDGGPLDLGFSLPLLFCWIFFCIFIPYFRSITGTPMLIIRYEIVILPAFLVLVSLGICLLRQRLMIFFIMACFLLMSFVNLFHHKEFYDGIRKEQLREAGRFAIETSEMKYPTRDFKFFSDIAGYYNVYFELMESELRVQEIDEPSLKEILAMDRKAEIGFWILSGHRPTPPAVIETLKRSGFEEIEKGEYHLASAMLYLRAASD